MNRVAIRFGGRGAVIGVLLALALLVRLVIPAGWMPVAGNGYAITLCTGAGMVSAWVDADGIVHKDDKGPAQQGDHPCTFAGLSADLLAGGALSALGHFVAFSGVIVAKPFETVAIGRGLAAPPPPPTGPPANL